MSTLPLETAQCADCYTVLFTEEMQQCPLGHWVCPGCVCDCTVLASAREHLTLWAEWGNMDATYARQNGGSQI